MTRHDDETRLHHMLDYAREAATRVSPEGQRRYDTIPWAEVRGLRNRLVHGYDIVDLNILWDIVQDDLPPLIAELERILEML